jgi:hypothetical protein
MIKTLRLTGVAAVAFAGLVLASVLGPVSVVRLDDKSDHRLQKVLSSPGAVERFHNLHGDKSTASQDTTPPLVRQAELFKDIIDPKLPPPVVSTPVSAPPARFTTPVKPVTTSAKFTLMGTSCSPSNPNASFAYIFADNKYQWVQCGESLGHLVIKEIREGSVVCWDGDRDSEIAMEPVPNRVSLLEADGAAASPAAIAVPQPVEARVTGIPVKPPRSSNHLIPPQAQSAMPRMNEGEHEAMSEIVDRLRQLQNMSGGDANAATEAERIALANKMIAELRSSRVSPQETRKLENLGDEVATDNDRMREEHHREMLKRLNAARSSKN